MMSQHRQLNRRDFKFEISDLNFLMCSQSYLYSRYFEGAFCSVFIEQLFPTLLCSQLGTAGIERFTDLYKLSLTWLNLFIINSKVMLESIFTTVRSGDSKNDACYKSDQRWFKNNSLTLIVLTFNTLYSVKLDRKIGALSILHNTT